MRQSDPLTAVTAVDTHGHHLSTGLPGLGGTAPQLELDGSGAGRIVRGDVTLRTVGSGLWDLAERLDEMDGAGVSHQVIQPVPVVMEHAWVADPVYARAVNDSIAAACKASDGRLIGLGCLPSADAGAELARCLDLGLVGIQVGTTMAGLDMDAPDLKPVWAACSLHGAAVFVHPVARGGEVIRRSGTPYDVGLAMLTDTAIAATALVFGGVIERHPELRVALAHGCGVFAWAYPRLRTVALEHEPASGRSLDSHVRRLYADSLVLDPEHLRLLVHRFGARRLLLGSDSPFLDVADAVSVVDQAVAAGALTASERDRLLVANALDFLGLTAAPASLTLRPASSESQNPIKRSTT